MPSKKEGTVFFYVRLAAHVSNGLNDSDKNLLIISHGAVIMTLLAMKRDIPFEQSHTIEVDNATPIEFSIEEPEEIRKKLYTIEEALFEKDNSQCSHFYNADYYCVGGTFDKATDTDRKNPY